MSSLTLSSSIFRVSKVAKSALKAMFLLVGVAVATLKFICTSIPFGFWFVKDGVGSPASKVTDVEITFIIKRQETSLRRLGVLVMTLTFQSTKRSLYSSKIVAKPSAKSFVRPS